MGVEKCWVRRKRTGKEEMLYVSSFLKLTTSKCGMTLTSGMTPMRNGDDMVAMLSGLVRKEEKEDSGAWATSSSIFARLERSYPSSLSLATLQFRSLADI